MVKLAWNGLGIRDHELKGDQMKDGLLVGSDGLQKPYSTKHTTSGIFSPVQYGRSGW